MSIWWTTPIRRGAIWSRAPSIWTAKTKALDIRGEGREQALALTFLGGAQGFDTRQNLAFHPFQEGAARGGDRSEEHTSELQSRENLVCRLLLEKKKH